MKIKKWFYESRHISIWVDINYMGVSNTNKKIYSLKRQVKGYGRVVDIDWKGDWVNDQVK